MLNNYFFITTYDGLSGSLLSFALNQHDDMHCDLSYMDPFVFKLYLQEQKLKSNVVEKYIELHSEKNKKFNGNIQRFSAFELQHRVLVEKTKSTLRKVNIVVSPQLRINLLLQSWSKTFSDSVVTLRTIHNKITELRKNQHNLFLLNNFDYFFNSVLNAVAQENIQLTCPEDELFLIALANVLTYDSADLAVGCKTFRLEDLAANKNIFLEFINYLTSKQINITEEYKSKLTPALKSINETLNKVQNKPWKDWQINLLDKFLNTHLRTIYYPHIDKPLIRYYDELGYQLKNEQPKALYSKLISIQLNSNRPTQLAAYFDNIEETADNPQEIEVLVNIDEHDSAMENLLVKETRDRKFTLKYTTTPKPNSFCDLWKPINKLLQLTDPNAYFLLNISDEMLFLTKGWDTVLKKYVGYFPDHIFRLRASRNKFRNYFDRWECSFAQDSIPITTKRWIDIGGDWNPCFGPDSYQQLIAFYLSKEGQFSNSHYLRELPLLDIKFHGDVPSLGMDQSKVWKHHRDHIRAMQICQSYPMQLEARKRAMLLKANIIAFSNQLSHYETQDIKNKKQIHLINKENNSVVSRIDYKLNPLLIGWTNQIRKLKFFAYFGGGKEYERGLIGGFTAYLLAINFNLKQLHLFVRPIFHFFKYSNKKSIYKNPLKIFKQFLRTPSLLMNRSIRKHNSKILNEEYLELLDMYKTVCLENEKLQKLILKYNNLENENKEILKINQS